jgi:hypothetical protein
MMLDADAQRVAWRDPASAWWVKLRRADQHIVEAAGRLEAFTSDEPWTVEAKPGPGSGEQNYRLWVHRAVPADLLAVLGDAVHNLRSALDAMAYGLAEQHCGTLTPEQERVTRLPICRDEAAFDGFLDHRNRGIRPRDLYGDVQIKALRLAASSAPPRSGQEAPTSGSSQEPGAIKRMEAGLRIRVADVVQHSRHLEFLAHILLDHASH